MAYEFEGQANRVANSGVRVVGILSDQTPNQGQIGQLLGEAFQVFGEVEGVFKAALEPVRRVKFAAVTVLTFLSKPGIKAKLKLGNLEGVFDEAIASLLRILDEAIPDPVQA